MIKKSKSFLKNRFVWITCLSIIISILTFLIIKLFWFPLFIDQISICQQEYGWEILEGFTGLITLSLVIGGSIFAWAEYSRQENQMNFQIYESINKRLTDPEEEASRRWIYENISPYEDGADKNIWLENFKIIIGGNELGYSIGKSHLKRVLNTLDYFGFLTENYINVEKPFLEWMSSPVAKMWERINLYVEYEREQRKEDDFYKSASYIGNKCIKYRNDENLTSRNYENAT